VVLLNPAAPYASNITMIGSWGTFGDVGVEDIQFRNPRTGAVDGNGHPIWAHQGVVMNFEGPLHAPQMTFYVSNVYMWECWNGIRAAHFNSSEIRNVTMQAMAGDWGIYAYGASEAGRCDQLKLSNINYSANDTARLYNRGTGYWIDGFVHTIQFNRVVAVTPYIGWQFTNSPGLPAGQQPNFLIGDDLEVDFPKYHAIYATHLDGFFVTNLYLHGSQQGSGLVVANPNIDMVKRIRVTQAKITDHAGDNVRLLCDDAEFHSVEATGWTTGVAVLAGTQRFFAVGGEYGGRRGVSAPWGVWRENPATWVSLTAAKLDGHLGAHNIT
jgi:hypothetical protein